MSDIAVKMACDTVLRLASGAVILVLFLYAVSLFSFLYFGGFFNQD